MYWFFTQTGKLRGENIKAPFKAVSSYLMLVTYGGVILYNE